MSNVWGASSGILQERALGWGLFDFLTLTFIDMMLDTDSSQRDRRCTVFLFFSFSHCGDPYKLPNPCVRIFDDAIFLISPFFLLIPETRIFRA